MEKNRKTSNELNNIDQLEDFSKAEIFDKYLEKSMELDKKILENEEYRATIQQLTELIRVGKKSQYGVSSEKIAPEDGVQLSLLDDEINLGVFNEVEEIVETTRRKPRRKKGEVGPNKVCFEHLPVQEVIYDLSEEEKTCSDCGTKLREFKTEERIELEIIPVQIIKKKYISKIYSCQQCEADGKNPIVNSSTRLPVFSGSYVSPSLLAYLMAKKYWEKVPVYRVERMFLNTGINIKRGLMSTWIIDGAHLYLRGVYNLMHEELLKTSSIIHADETPIQVLKEPGRKAQTKSYMWIYLSGHLEPKQICLYQYKPGRSGNYAADFLSGYTGYLQTDGYAGYRKVKGVNKIGCVAHARRKFNDAVTALGPSPHVLKATLTHQGLNYFHKIFDLETKFQDLSAEKRYEKRLEQTKPLLEALKSWLHKTRRVAAEKSKLGEAIRYTLNQWDELVKFLEDGRIEITNNRAERGIKEFVIGRKNWLFSASVKGAEASEIIYSIVETAKANKLHPYEYLKYLIEELSQNKQTDEKLQEVLPWSDQLPDRLKIKYEQK